MCDHTGEVRIDKVVGNDGKNDGKVYVIKTKEKEFRSEDDRDPVPGAGLSDKAYKETKDFIKDNSGNTAEFDANPSIYNNTIEIEGSQENRQAMMNEMNKDNGKGGKSDANNKEYSVTGNQGVQVQEPGPISSPKFKEIPTSTVMSDGTQSFAHSHPSGSIVETTGSQPGTTSFGSASMTSTWNYRQPPSPWDVEHARTTNYVFGMRNGIVYIYNSKGVQATMPMKNFVNFKK